MYKYILGIQKYKPMEKKVKIPIEAVGESFSRLVYIEIEKEDGTLLPLVPRKTNAKKQDSTYELTYEDLGENDYIIIRALINNEELEKVRENNFEKYLLHKLNFTIN